MAPNFESHCLDRTCTGCVQFNPILIMSTSPIYYDSPMVSCIAASYSLVPSTSFFKAHASPYAGLGTRLAASMSSPSASHP